MANPTYHDLGDHTETLQIDYDPSQVSYTELLAMFWQSHNPRARSWSRQYMAAIFTHNDEQQRLAQESKARLEEAEAGEIMTNILPAATFYLAEDYHQKYWLRQRRDLLKAVQQLYPTSQAFIDSTLAARLNGYLAGHGTLEAIRQLVESLTLSPEEKESLLKLID